MKIKDKIRGKANWEVKGCDGSDGEKHNLKKDGEEKNTIHTAY